MFVHIIFISITQSSSWFDWSEASLGLEIHDAKTFFDMLTGVSEVPMLPNSADQNGRGSKIKLLALSPQKGILKDMGKKRDAQHISAPLAKTEVLCFQDKYVEIDTFVKGCMRMKGPATSIDMLSMGGLTDKRSRKGDVKTRGEEHMFTALVMMLNSL